MGQQPLTMAAALNGGGDRQVGDQQVVAAIHQLDQRDQFVAGEEQVDPVLTHGLVVVGRHGQRPAADHRNPFGIGRLCQRADGGGVG